MEYTFKAMLDRLNTVSENEWKDSKLRYYLLDILNERRETPGVKATYSAQTLGKLVFLAKVMESPIKPSIKQALQILEDVSDAELIRFAEGTEDIVFAEPGIDDLGRPVYKTLSGEFALQNEHRFGREIQTSLISEAVSDSAMDYIAREFSPHLDAPGRSQPRTKWQYMKLGPDLEIRYRKKLNRQRKKQLRLAGELIRSILSEED